MKDHVWQLCSIYPLVQRATPYPAPAIITTSLEECAADITNNILQASTVMVDLNMTRETTEDGICNFSLDSCIARDELYHPWYFVNFKVSAPDTHLDDMLVCLIMDRQDRRLLTRHGFITDKDRFLNREESNIIAINANQVFDNKVGEDLISEDLY